MTLNPPFAVPSNVVMMQIQLPPLPAALWEPPFAKKIPAALVTGLFACTPGPEFVFGMLESRINLPDSSLADSWSLLFAEKRIHVSSRRSLPGFPAYAAAVLRIQFSRTNRKLGS